MKTWKPTAAGILSIISGAFMAWYHWGPHTPVETIPLGIALGLIAIAGGIFAIRRKVWGLALAGAICAIVPAHPWGDLTWTPVLGILAALLVVGSKNEFSSSASKSHGAEHGHTGWSADGRVTPKSRTDSDDFKHG
jgi:hypothetical protein